MIFRIFHWVGMDASDRFSGQAGGVQRTAQGALGIAVVALSGMLLGGCGSMDAASNRVATFISPYKMDIVQGNFVSREQAALLKPGMAKIQVRELLGTPLLTSVFHGDRWDYPFTFRRQGLEPQARRVTVFFKGEVLDRVEADNLPSEAEFVNSLDSGRSTGKVPVLQASPEVLAKIAADRAAAASPPAGAAAAVAPSSPRPAAVTPDRYPPLEPAR
jgi:outer membrane protein assembly factor BamE